VAEVLFYEGLEKISALKMSDFIRKLLAISERKGDT
jgi:hypothetical protein